MMNCPDCLMERVEIIALDPLGVCPKCGYPKSQREESFDTPRVLPKRITGRRIPVVFSRDRNRG